jgi:hypothetical protein
VQDGIPATFYVEQVRPADFAESVRALHNLSWSSGMISSPPPFRT